MVLLIAALGACAPVSPRTASPAAPAPDELMGLIPGPVRSLLAIDLAQLRGSPWSKPVLESAAPAAGRQDRGFDEIGDVDRWLLANVRAPGSGTATLELGRGRFNRARVEASFRERHPSAREQRFGGALGLADSEAAITFPLGGTLALGPTWAVQAAVRAAEPASKRADPWLAEAMTAVDQEVGAGSGPARPAVALWLRLDETSRTELAAALGSADAIDWIAGRLTLARDARATAVAVTRADAEAIGLAAQLTDQLAALSERRSIQALGLQSVLQQATVRARGRRVVLELAVSEDERDTVSLRLAALAEVLARSRARTADEP